MAASKNYYEEIGVSQNASVEEITNVVKQLVKTNHPDNFTDAKQRENAQQRLRVVKRAYETLKDENLRWEYDLSLFGDSENTSNHNATKHPTKSKTSSFKFISGLILGTAAVTASGTIYLSGLDCSNQRNVVDATICEKTQPIRSLFGSDEKQPVVAEASKVEPETIAQDTAVSNQTPVEAPTPEIEQPKNEPAPALASATVSFDNSTPVKSEPELPTATASFQPVASTPVATTNNSNDECYNLWYQRNLIYAQNGYCFTSNLGKEAFKDFKCFTSSQNLPNKDQVKANNFKSREAALNCNVDTNSTTIPTATKNVAPVQNQVASISNSPQAPISESYSQSSNANPIQTLVAEGVGITPQDAAQNAAENALKNVVGAFIDTNMNLEKKTLIYDGLKSETKNISKDIKEYSQGSIKSFEIIDVKQQSGLYRLKAKVAVRNEQFSAYVKQLATGEVHTGNIGSEIYAQIATAEKQERNVIDIIQNNIIEPIYSGTVQEITIDKPLMFQEALKQNKVPLPFSKVFSEHSEEMNAAMNERIVIKYNIHLKNEFIANLNKTLSEISLSSKYIENDKSVMDRIDESNKDTTFRIKILKQTKANKPLKFFEIKVSNNMLLKQNAHKTTYMNFFDKDNEVIKHLLLNENNFLTGGIMPDISNATDLLFIPPNINSTKESSCNLINQMPVNLILIREDVNCYAILKLDMDVIKNMAKIEVGLE